MYLFGQKLMMYVSEDMESVSGCVSLEFDYPMFPSPDCSEFTKVPIKLLRFVFGDELGDSSILRGMKYQTHYIEKNENLYGGNSFSFSQESKGSCTIDQISTAVNLFYDYIYDRIPQIRRELQVEFDNSHKRAKERHPLLYMLGLTRGHFGGATFSSDWTKHPEWKSHPQPPEEKESYLKTRKMRVFYEQFSYKANRFRPASPKLTRYDIFEPVPGRTNTDDYGCISKETD